MPCPNLVASGRPPHSVISPISNQKLKILDNKAGFNFGKAIYLSRSQILENKKCLLFEIGLIADSVASANGGCRQQRLGARYESEHQPKAHRGMHFQNIPVYVVEFEVWEVGTPPRGANRHHVARRGLRGELLEHSSSAQTTCARSSDLQESPER